MALREFLLDCGLIFGATTALPGRQFSVLGQGSSLRVLHTVPQRDIQHPTIGWGQGSSLRVLHTVPQSGHPNIRQSVGDRARHFVYFILSHKADIQHPTIGWGQGSSLRVLHTVPQSGHLTSDNRLGTGLVATRTSYCPAKGHPNIRQSVGDRARHFVYFILSRKVIGFSE
jgi:hypothetical protein